jgi:hypothetical protein
MRIRRTLPIVLAVVSVAAAVTLAVQLRKNAPPEPARLLPGADGFFYLDLNAARKMSGSSMLPAVSHDPEYERFIQETDFQFERDLDAAAFAIHYPAKWPGGGTGGPASEPRFSEVFLGKFDGVKLAGYLKQRAQSVESYNSVDIFTIPIDGRTLRVAILGVGVVAASNHDNPDVIRGVVDRSRRLASPFGGPALLRRYYKRVQFASPAWVVAHIPASEPGVSALSTIFTQPADLVVSISYNPLRLPLHPGSLHFRAEALTGSMADARNATEKLNTYLALFHSAETSAGSQANDPDMKAMFDSLKVQQEDQRAVLSATVPPGFLKKLLAEAPEVPAPTLSAPTEAPQGETSPERAKPPKSKPLKNPKSAAAKDNAKP